MEPSWSVSGDAERLSLSGRWRLEGEDVGGEPFGCPADVPGDVYGALFGAGRIPDPYFGRNERDVQWVAKKKWTFSREFAAPSGFLSRRSVVLRLEDCDTFATVFVNGLEVGRTHDRFVRYDFDAKDALRPGLNEIRIVFDSAWEEGDRLAAASPRPHPMSNSEMGWFVNGAMVRKPSCHRGWDWGLALMTTGPCGEVSLVASDGDRIDAVWCDQEFRDGLSHCTLAVNALLETGETVRQTVEIDDPPLWWPAGEGPQEFYRYSVSVHGHPLRGRVGLRKLEIDTAGGALSFRVNGRPVFMKGANWIPCDAFDFRQTPARYRDLLESARAANMNMVRLWGGGQYEKDCFYDICDELGLMVWHDQMFSCALYPATPEFLADVRAEVEYQILRLRDHACIALWCGDNECIGAARGWFGDIVREEDRPIYVEECRKRFEVIEDAVSRLDPSRRFWPSSPCTGSADFDHDAWHEDGKGDMHVWTVWHENKPFSDYYNYKPRFCSEFGFQSFPSPEVARTFCPPGKAAGGEPDFEWHQKNVGGNERIKGSFGRLFRKPAGPDEELWLSQVQQAVGIKTAVEAWRTLRPRCMGTLFWQLDDLWPVSSWSSLEYGGKWKHLHYHARRFYAPVAIMAKPSEDGSALEIWALNDTAEAVAADASVRLCGFGGETVFEETLRRSGSSALAPGSATLLASRPLDSFGTALERRGRFLALALSSPLPEVGVAVRPAVVHRNEWFFAPFKDCALEKARVSAELSFRDGTPRATLSTDRPAFFVWANAEGVRGEFDDNSFTLLPGSPRTLEFRPKGDAPAEEAFRKAFSVSHLALLQD